MTDLSAKLDARPATFTCDKSKVGPLYYFAVADRAPGPYKTQRHVEAIIDIADDGTLAGVELIDNMPPPPLAQQALRSQGEGEALAWVDPIVVQLLQSKQNQGRLSAIQCGVFNYAASGSAIPLFTHPAPQEAGDVKVKPLEWEKHNVDGTFWTSQVTICGEYKVKHTGKEWDAWVGVISIAKTQTCDEAKAAAFAYHVARILSNLTEGSSR